LLRRRVSVSRSCSSRLVLGLAAGGDTRASVRLAAVLAPTEVADQLDDLVDAEDWLWCVVGVAAGVGDLVRFDSEHRLVARDADVERVHWGAQSFVLK
jgi:hypothetical protein